MTVPRRAALLTGAVAAAAHAGPALTSFGWVRRRGFDRLSGAGRLDHVALTFDDGPDPVSTPPIMEALSRMRWRVTFFMLGSMVEKSPGLAAEVAAAGHEIALHGYEHRSHLRRTPAAVAADLQRGLDAIGAATGVRPRWFRPPFGNLSGGSLLAAHRLGLQTVLWTAWGRDWRAQATAESVVSDVCRTLRPGGTALLHDSDCTSAAGCWRSTLGALPMLEQAVESMGVEIGPLADHAVV